MLGMDPPYLLGRLLIGLVVSFPQFSGHLT